MQACEINDERAITKIIYDVTNILYFRTVKNLTVSYPVLYYDNQSFTTSASVGKSAGSNL
jgi:hypothetical protein